MNSKKILADLGTSPLVVLHLAENPEDRYRGILMGLVPGDMVLVQAEEAPPIWEKQKVIVRLVREGKAIGFESTVLHRVEKPVLMFFLAKPDNIEVVSLRKAERMDVFVPVDLRHTSKSGNEDNTHILQGYMTNVSGGGCRVLTKFPIAAESVIQISFSLPLEKHLYTLSGTVLESTVQKSSQKTVFGHRVRFFPSEKHAQDLGEIRRWIQQNMDFTDLFQ